MRKLIVTEFLSLDGILEEPSDPWTTHYAHDDGQFKYNELFESDTLLLGRVTYEGFLEYWPGQAGKNAFADRMNSLPKYVVTNALTTLEWNATAIRQNILQEVATLKESEGQNILVYGSGQLAQDLLAHGLVDELRLMIFPLIQAKGKRFFTGDTRVPLTLVDSRNLGDGVMLLTYGPDPHRLPPEKETCPS